MSYFVKYTALHRCSAGHEFYAPANPSKPDSIGCARCPVCLEAFLQRNIPDGLQVGEAKQEEIGVVQL